MAGTTGRSEQGANTGATNRTPDTSAVAPPFGGAPVVNNPGSADQTRNADNTRINDRDRHAALTPMNQGNSGAETKITAAIRRGIMSDKTLSFTAKNVKVITVGSKVTLRGPVKSDQEKAAIEAVAKQTDGVSEVDDQLEVKQ
jgi:osmotically-inducible protein OsmY